MHSKLSEHDRQVIDFLDELCEEEIITYPIEFESGLASDDEWSETAGHWFGSGRWAEGGDSFVHFGSDGTGGCFLLWYYPDLDGDPPVVFLGSEGESCMASPTVTDFLKQLASGKVFFEGSWLDPDDEEEEDDDFPVLDWVELKASVEARFGEADMDPEDVTARAVAEHPDFPAWVESRCG